MTSQAAQLTHAIAEALNDAAALTFAESFTAEALYVVEYPLTELETLRVSVVPRTMQHEKTSRSHDRREVRVDVAVQQRCAPDDATRIDQLMAFTEQIEAYLNRRPLEGAAGSVWFGASIDPLYDAAMLRELRVFTSVIELTYLMP